MYQGILDRLNAGEVVVGDGGYVMQLERRGHVKAGHWTPEAAVEHPEAGKTRPPNTHTHIPWSWMNTPHTHTLCLLVRQLHREFLRAGANVIQTFTFYCSEDKLVLSGNVAEITVG